VALIHYPVVNKNGDIIASAVTNLDLHDIARASRTYGVRRFYVVTPLEDQQELVGRIVDHWITGGGSIYNPKRKSALELIRIKPTLEAVREEIRQKSGSRPRLVATCARNSRRSTGFAGLREEIKNGEPYLLLFGTAWGLAEEVMDQTDYLLEPVIGLTDYNHLSVRAAAAVILDRLAGNQRISI